VAGTAEPIDSPTAAAPLALPKVPTGNEGIDRILRGGLPEGRTTLLSGGPGCGKSLLALEFAVRSARTGHPAIFIPFEERLEAVRANAGTLGWNLEDLESRKLLFLLDARIDYESVRTGSFDLKGLLAMVQGIARSMKSNRLCLDAIDALLRLYNDKAREREQLLILNEWLTDHGFTSVLTVKRTEGHEADTHYEFLDYLADCVIHLDQRVSAQVTTRRFRVIKYRGSGYGRNEYPYVIGEQGIRVVPISSVELRHQGLGPRLTTGLSELDRMLGGGYLKASAILIAGAAGTGKTTLASIFSCSAANRQERVLYIGFEESMEAVVSSMLSSGTDLRPALKAGLLKPLTAMPESMGSEEHLLRVLDAVEGFRPDHVVLDAVSATKRIGSERAAFEFLVRLLNVCRETGITTILLNQTSGVIQSAEVAGEEISSIVDAILFLRYTEIGGEINRLISVTKSRGSQH
jgi:circadian clock protein KaiC